MNLLPIYNIYCFVLQESIKRTLVVFEDPNDDELETQFLYCIITCMLTQIKLSRLHNVILFGESRLKCLVMWSTVDGLIDWCLTPTLAVFRLYRGINTFCETRRLGRVPIGILMVRFMVFDAFFNNMSVI